MKVLSIEMQLHDDGIQLCIRVQLYICVLYILAYFYNSQQSEGLEINDMNFKIYPFVHLYKSLYKMSMTQTKQEKRTI